MGPDISPGSNRPEVVAPCRLCGGTGMIRWDQSVPQPDGSFQLRAMEHPCVNGCSGWWKLPASERGRVVEGGLSGVDDPQRPMVIEG